VRKVSPDCAIGKNELYVKVTPDCENLGVRKLILNDANICYDTTLRCYDVEDTRRGKSYLLVTSLQTNNKDDIQEDDLKKIDYIEDVTVTSTNNFRADNNITVTPALVPSERSSPRKAKKPSEKLSKEKKRSKKELLKLENFEKNIKPYFTLRVKGENKENKNIFKEENTKLKTLHAENSEVLDHVDFAMDTKQQTTKQQTIDFGTDQSRTRRHTSFRCHDSLDRGEARDWPGGNKTVSGGPMGGGNMDYTMEPGDTGPMGSKWLGEGLENSVVLKSYTND
jgi:hypothetical protein